MRLAALLLLAASTSALAAAPDARLTGSYKFPQSGWTYVHLTGTPEQIGYQHGALLTHEIEDNLHVFQLENSVTLHKDWSFFRDAGRTILWPHIEPEYQAELRGIAAGLKANGSKLDLWDVVAMTASSSSPTTTSPGCSKKKRSPSP